MFSRLVDCKKQGGVLMPLSAIFWASCFILESANETPITLRDVDAILTRGVCKKFGKNYVPAKHACGKTRHRTEYAVYT
jgi:hypothetical protein